MRWSVGLLILSSCELSPMSSPPLDSSPASLERALGAELEVCDLECRAEPTDIFSSFVVTDPVILDRFPLRRVLDQLASFSGTGSTADSIWKQWWLSQRERTGGDPGQWPFCDDNGATINGFPIECPRAESDIASIPIESHGPVALFNRFDLMPLDGHHCGEYRIVYAMNAPRTEGGIGGRNFVIFEGVLPNPRPDCGPAACQEVAQFWQALTTEPDMSVRADALDEFYFKGICEFEPVVKPEHYGLDCRTGGGYGQGCGQIRTNQFVDRPWNLREFTLRRDFTDSAGELIVQQTTVKQNPHFSLFDSSHPMFSAFEPNFLGQMPLMLPVPDGVSLIAGGTDGKFDAGESISQAGPGDNDYLPDLPFDVDIANELLALGMPGTVSSGDVAERATSQSCGGCHELSNFDDLGTTNGFGPSTIWPPSLGFVHVDEASNLSPALLTEFLPHRQRVMANFLDATCGVECLPPGARLVKEGASEEGEVTFDVKSRSEVKAEGIVADPEETLGGSRVH